MNSKQIPDLIALIAAKSLPLPNLTKADDLNKQHALPKALLLRQLEAESRNLGNKEHNNPAPEFIF